MKARGLYTGGRAPYGYRVENGALLEDADEMMVIAEAKRLRAAGLTLRKTIKALTDQGMHPRQVQRWSVSAVDRLVKIETSTQEQAAR